MQYNTLIAPLLTSLLALAACSPPDAPLAPPGPGSSSARDPSVPDAALVLDAPATNTAKDEPAMRSSGTLTRAQESNAMPMPGQVNNHSSTALDPVKRGASAP